MDMNQITQALSLSLSNKEQERKASAEIILHVKINFLLEINNIY